MSARSQAAKSSFSISIETTFCLNPFGLVNLFFDGGRRESSIDKGWAKSRCRLPVLIAFVIADAF
jgi:hypothetical protein